MLSHCQHGPSLAGDLWQQSGAFCLKPSSLAQRDWNMQLHIVSNIPVITHRILQELQHDLESGNLKNVYVRNSASEGGEDVPLSELQSKQQQHDSPQPELEGLGPASAATSKSTYQRSASFSSEHAANSSPASEVSSKGGYVNKQGAVTGAAAQQEEHLPAWVDANAAGAIDSKRTTAGGAESGPTSEHNREDHLHELEAKKLAKQQELFGKSFSTPQRCKRPSEPSLLDVTPAQFLRKSLDWAWMYKFLP